MPCSRALHLKSCCRSGALKLVQSIQRRHFVSFGQSWIVEDGVAKIFNGTGHRQYRLTNVYDLRCAITNYMNTKEP